MRHRAHRCDGLPARRQKSGDCTAPTAHVHDSCDVCREMSDEVLGECLERVVVVRRGRRRGRPESPMQRRERATAATDQHRTQIEEYDIELAYELALPPLIGTRGTGG